MTTSPSTCLEARGVSVTFGAHVVLDGVDFAARLSEVAVIEGPSGGGKSTFLRALATLQEVSGGDVLLEGIAASAIAPTVYRTRVAYVPQIPTMFAGTVADNVRAGPKLRGVALTDERVGDLLRRVAMSPAIAGTPARDLSGGQKQRVAIARALANEPKAILFDEPTSALDPESADAILELVRKCATDGCAVVVVTHSREQAEALSGTRYTCEGGKVLPRRTP